MGIESALSSVQSAVRMTMMKKAMNADSQSMGQLLQAMEQSQVKIMEASVTPHLGVNIDMMA